MKDIERFDKGNKIEVGAGDFGLPRRWPLVPVDVAAFYLNRPPEDVARDCDSWWAWDISSGGSHRRQLRIWRDSLIAVKNPSARVPIPARMDAVIESFLPKRGMRGRELQEVLFCGPQLITVLDEARLLKVERDRLAADGPRSSRVYTHQSIASFFKIRSLVASFLHPNAHN